MIPLFEQTEIFKDIQTGKKETSLISGADKAYKIALTLYLYRAKENTVFFVCQNDFDAKKYYAEFLKYADKSEVLFYPKEPLYFTYADSFSREITNLRLKVMMCAIQNRKAIIVTSIWALCEQRLFSQKDALKSFHSDDSIPIPELSKLLYEYGYEREEKTEAPGQFSVRGGIVDYYSATEPYPVRIEFFGDEIDSIRYFDADSQLSVETIDSFQIFPFTDFLLSEDEIINAASAMKSEADKTLAKIKDETLKKTLKENAAELFEKISERPFEAARLVYMYTGKELQSVLSMFQHKEIVLCESAQLKRSYDFIKKSVANDFASFNESALAFKTQMRIFSDYAETMQNLEQNDVFALSVVEQSAPYLHPKNKFNAACADMIDYKGNINIFIKQLASYLQNEYKIILTYENELQKNNLTNLMETYRLKVSARIASGEIYLTKLNWHHGMDFAARKILIFPYGGIVAAEIKDAPKKKVKKREKEAFFSDIQPGDYVVHEVHGIGRYDGIHQISLEGISKDYLKVTYAKEDVLYVPAEQMDLIQKYIGASDSPPKLSRLGTADWTSTKTKVSGAVKELALEYIQMYAQRQSLDGYAFSEDTSWQREFEQKFAFEPTEDQIRCTQEIKADMEKPVPMDRLLCGDVGYGKTEVAQRAAFKAVMDSKQVAVLVPTTILALQHYNNFVERFKGYPIKIEMMSRLRNANLLNKTAENIRAGRTDIVIGTHRMLSKDVKFKDLGLLIVDEEQRFGVTHKDKLKLIKANVDTLTLSATPIPRTLHMSLTGIRDMSIIENPPVNRVEVQTYVMEYEDIVIKEAVKNELARDGQVFYVYNRVQDIERCAAHLQTLVPEAKVVYAHGQMKETQLEKIILGFLNKEYDVLVCTTIIENGVDIINANTLIIENADHLGLSQLYQLRGRVGRSDAAAYAYMTYRKDKTLSELASKRLQSIKEFTKFGSGFKIAMRDLQVRGAGNLLGANQHGHFQNVGYEMYCRLLSDAVKEELGQNVERKRETEIDLNVSAYLPKDYISAEQQRIEIYKTIASIENEQDMEKVTEEIIDVYSDMPQSVNYLLHIAYIKSLAQKIGVKKLKQTGEMLNIDFYENGGFDAVKIQALSKRYFLKVKNRQLAPAVTVRINDVKNIIEVSEDLMKNLI